MATIFNQRRWRRATPVLLDNALVVAVVAASAYAQTGLPAGAGIDGPALWARVLLMSGVFQLCLYFSDFYDGARSQSSWDTTLGIVQAVGAATVLLALAYLIIPALTVGPGVFLLGIACVTAAFTGWRLALSWIGTHVGSVERLLFLGTTPAAVDLARELASRREGGAAVVGFVESEPGSSHGVLPGAGVVGTVSDIPEIVYRERVDRVVVNLGDARGKLNMGELLTMKLDGIRFDYLASVYEEFTRRIPLENLRPSWLVFSDGFSKGRRIRITKRTVDVVVASLGLLLAAPVCLVIMAAVRLTSAGPALYHQRRTGRHGRVFVVHKFRTMREDAEADRGPTWAQVDDPRVTPVGRFLRGCRLDELPQLWNVLVGDMSLIGPRPERPEFVEQLSREIPFFGLRHVVKPGLTGWAQVSYSYVDSVEDTMKKLQYDLFYIKNMSLALDAFILFSTAKTVVLRRGAR